MIINSSVNGTATTAYLVSVDQLAAKAFSIRVCVLISISLSIVFWRLGRAALHGRIIHCIAGVFIPSGAFRLSTKRAG